MGLVYVAIFFALLLVVGLLWSELKVYKARRSGIYPAKGQATMEDVKRLALSGDTPLAIRAYSEIHGGSLKDAKEAVTRIVASGGKTEKNPDNETGSSEMNNGKKE